MRKLKNSLKHKDSIGSRSRKGGVWLGVGSAFEQGLRFARNMILVRLLAPEVFGIMAIVLSISTAFESFTQIGIKEAVIQNKKGGQESYLNSAWWVASLRAVFLYLLMFLCAPAISTYYENEQLTMLLRISFLSILFNGFMSPKAYVLQKHMRFGKWVMIFHGGGAIGIVLAVALSFWLKSVWALVIGFTVEFAMRFILSYLIAPFRPRFQIDHDHMRAILKYAKGMLGLPILTFIFMKLDVFVIGKMMDLEQLGIYAMVAVMGWFPFQFITMLVSQVMMPAISENQNDFQRINKWILFITKVIVYISMPFFAFCLFHGYDLISLIYGEKYAMAAIPFAIIVGTAMFRTCSVPIATLFLAIGRPGLHRTFTGIRALILIVAIYPAIQMYGLKGAAGSALVSMLISYLFQLKKVNIVTGLDIKKYLKIFFWGIVYCLIMAPISLTADNLLQSTPMVNILPGVIGFIIVYTLMIIVHFKQIGIYKINMLENG